jgi:hypothetical protein
MAKDYKDLVVGLDIGTAKVMVVVAEVMPGGELKLAGLGVAPSSGLKRGVVVNIDATVQSIQQALKEAELMADCKITRVYTGITGSHIRGINSSGMVAVKDREVTPADVARVVENRAGDQHLHRPAPAAGGAAGIRDRRPGRAGADRHERHPLEAKVHIVTGAQSAAENIIKCVRRCGLEVEQLLLNPLASSSAGAVGRREGTGRGDGGHRRRHHRRGHLHRRRDPPHRGDPDRRRPDHQRHRHGAAHADQGRRGHQGGVRLRQAAAGRRRRRRWKCRAWATAARACCRARRWPA